MKAITEIANKLTDMLDEAKTPDELAMIVETMVECYSTPVIIAAFMAEIIDLKEMSFDEDEEELDEEENPSYMS